MRRTALILTIVLFAQAGVFYGFSRSEKEPKYRPFDSFPGQLSDWKLVQKRAIEDDVRNVLRGDDYISGWYSNSRGHVADLFVAFFKSQRYGQTPHSPKNCLPGSGWVWTVSDEIDISVPGRAAPITVNRYIISKGESKSVVLYWYQSRDRVVASEYKAKIFVVADALRYNRTDTALVRVVVPVQDGKEQLAQDIGVDFVKSFFGTLKSYLPN
jgi:EpsI family protein